MEVEIRVRFSERMSARHKLGIENPHLGRYNYPGLKRLSCDSANASCHMRGTGRRICFPAFLTPPLARVVEIEKAWAQTQ
jgi:hypothetical protein